MENFVNSQCLLAQPRVAATGGGAVAVGWPRKGGVSRLGAVAAPLAWGATPGSASNAPPGRPPRLAGVTLLRPAVEAAAARQRPRRRQALRARFRTGPPARHPEGSGDSGSQRTSGDRHQPGQPAPGQPLRRLSGGPMRLSMRLSVGSLDPSRCCRVSVEASTGGLTCANVQVNAPGSTPEHPASRPCPTGRPGARVHRQGRCSGRPPGLVLLVSCAGRRAALHPRSGRPGAPHRRRTGGT